MSMVIDRPVAGRSPASSSARPAGKVKSVRKASRQKAMNVTIVGSLCILGVSYCISFVASSVTGNMMLEQARQQRIKLEGRAHLATTEVSRLRRSMDELTSMESVDRWAKAQGMVLSGVALPEIKPEAKPTAKPATQNYVATNR